MSAEFLENLQGRAARTSQGLATFLFDNEDSDTVLDPVEAYVQPALTYIYYKNHSMSSKEGNSELEGFMWDASVDISSSSGWDEVPPLKKRRVDIFGLD